MAALNTLFVHPDGTVRSADGTVVAGGIGTADFSATAYTTPTTFPATAFTYNSDTTRSESPPEKPVIPRTNRGWQPKKDRSRKGASR